MSITTNIKRVEIEEIRDALREPGDFEGAFQIPNTIDPMSSDYKDVIFGQYEQITAENTEPITKSTRSVVISQASDK